MMQKRDNSQKFSMEKTRGMIIKKDEYLNKLSNKKQNGLIKGVTGIQRCGKSYLVYLSKNGYGAIVVLSLEEYSKLTDSAGLALNRTDKMAEESNALITVK